MIVLLTRTPVTLSHRVASSRAETREHRKKTQLENLLTISALRLRRMRLASRLGSYCTRRFRLSMSASPEASPLRLEHTEQVYEPNRRYPLFRMGERFKHEQEQSQEYPREEQYAREGEEHFPAQNMGNYSTRYQEPYYAGNGHQYQHDVPPYSQAQYWQGLQHDHSL